MSDLDAFTPERGRSRCGDSYLDTISVTGEVAGADGHGRELVDSIKPVSFDGGRTFDLDQVDMRGESLEGALESVRARIDNVAEYIGIYGHFIDRAIDNPAALSWLITRARAELERAEELDERRPALPSATAAESTADLERRIRGRIREALKVIRCAQYWAVRARLYGEALETMPVRPVGGFALRTDPKPIDIHVHPIPLPLPDTLPDPVIPDPVVEPTGPGHWGEPVGAKATETTPWPRYAAIGLAGAGLYMLATKR